MMPRLLPSSSLQLCQPLPEAQPHARMPQSLDEAFEGAFLVADRVTRSALLLMVLAHV